MLNPQDNQHYQIWQNQPLAELGVTRWASQDSPVIELTLEQLADSLEPFFEPIDWQKTNDEPHNEAFFYLDEPHHDSYQINELADDEIDEPDVNTAKIIDKFSLQALIFRDWIILADTDVLIKNDKQLQLWQNIAKNLHLTPQDFTFPLLSHQSDGFVSMMTQEQMCTDVLALAMFEGFVCRFNQNNVNQKNNAPRKIGCVTPLPNVFNTLEIKSLVSLNTMLKNSKQKGIFWQSLL